MSRTYQLSCPNGHSLDVDSSQAGLAIRCLCGAEVKVPTYRELLALASSQSPAIRAPRKSAAASDWGWPQATIMVGLAALAACSLAAISVWSYYPPYPELEVDPVKNLQDLNALPMENLLPLWDELKKGPDRGQNLPIITTYERMSSHYRLWLQVIAGAAAISVVAMLVGVAGVLFQAGRSAKS